MGRQFANARTPGRKDAIFASWRPGVLSAKPNSHTSFTVPSIFGGTLAFKSVLNTASGAEVWVMQNFLPE
jgi:hypothetical protein